MANAAATLVNNAAKRVIRNSVRHAGPAPNPGSCAVTVCGKRNYYVSSSPSTSRNGGRSGDGCFGSTTFDINRRRRPFSSSSSSSSGSSSSSSSGGKSEAKGGSGGGDSESKEEEGKTTTGAGETTGTRSEEYSVVMCCLSSFLHS